MRHLAWLQWPVGVEDVNEVRVGDVEWFDPAGIWGEPVVDAQCVFGDVERVRIDAVFVFPGAGSQCAEVLDRAGRLAVSEGDLE